MKCLPVFTLCCCAFLAVEANAHGGRLAADGCHNEKATGTRHCHQSGTESKSQSRKSRTEDDYVQTHCRGVVEHRLPDNTRVDCLTDSHAIEYDFGRKWAEAIGQSLHYARMTNKRAGIVLILKRGGQKYADRTQAIIDAYSLPIDLFSIPAD